jgi:hypothetical protein
MKKEIPLRRYPKHMKYTVEFYFPPSPEHHGDGGGFVCAIGSKRVNR